MNVNVPDGKFLSCLRGSELPVQREAPLADFLSCLRGSEPTDFDLIGEKSVSELPTRQRTRASG